MQTIQIDGEYYTDKQAIELAKGCWPMRVGTPCLSDAITMLRLIGSQVVAQPKGVVGIDNGLHGAIVVLATSDGSVIAKRLTPIRQRNGKNEIDVLALHIWLKATLIHPSHYDFVLERPVGSKSVNAATSMHSSFHAIRATIELLGGNFHDVTAKRWQKDMMPDGDTKQQSIAVAQARWPDEDWRKSTRSKKPYPDLCDAANIAEHHRCNTIQNKKKKNHG